MVCAGLYGPRLAADPSRTCTGVCDVGGEPCCAATAPVAGSTNAALTPTATSPAAVRRRRMELRMVMLTSPSSTYRPGMAADLPPWPQGGLKPHTCYRASHMFVNTGQSHKIERNMNLRRYLARSPRRGADSDRNRVQ